MQIGLEPVVIQPHSIDFEAVSQVPYDVERYRIGEKMDFDGDSLRKYVSVLLERDDIDAKGANTPYQVNERDRPIRGSFSPQTQRAASPTLSRCVIEGRVEDRSPEQVPILPIALLAIVTVRMPNRFAPSNPTVSFGRPDKMVE